MNSNQITTTILPRIKDIQELFSFLEINILGDIMTMSGIKKGTSDFKTYCAVPEALSLFAFSDLVGSLISNEKNENTSKNLELFFLEYFDDEYKLYFPILKKIYRHGIMHSYFPKSIYWGISKIYPEDDKLFIENSLNVNKFTKDVLKAYDHFKNDCMKDDELNSIVLENWKSQQEKSYEDAVIQFLLLCPKDVSIYMEKIRNLKLFEIWLDIANEKKDQILNIINKYPNTEINILPGFFNEEFVTFQIKASSLSTADKILEKVNQVFKTNNIDDYYWNCTYLMEIENYNFHIISWPEKFLLNIAKKHIIEYNLSNYEYLIKDNKSALKSTSFFLSKDIKISQRDNISRHKPFSDDLLYNYRKVINWTEIYYNDEIEWQESYASNSGYLPNNKATFTRFCRYFENLELGKGTNNLYEVDKLERPYFYKSNENKLVFGRKKEKLDFPMQFDDKDIYSFRNTFHPPIYYPHKYYFEYDSISATNMSHFTNISLNDLKKYEEILGKVILLRNKTGGSWGRDGSYDEEIVSLLVGLQHNKHFIVNDGIFEWLINRKVYNVKHSDYWSWNSNDNSGEPFSKVYTFIRDKVDRKTYRQENNINDLNRIFSVEGTNPEQSIQFPILNLSANFTLSHITEIIEGGYIKYNYGEPKCTLSILVPFISNFLDDNFVKKYLSILKSEYSEEEWFKNLMATVN